MLSIVVERYGGVQETWLKWQGKEWVTYDVCRVTYRTWRRFRDSNGDIDSPADFLALCEMIGHDWLALVNLVVEGQCRKMYE